MGMGYQLYMYCWYGNQVTQAVMVLERTTVSIVIVLSYLQSSLIRNAMFESDWLSEGDYFKKCVLLTLTRMMKPIGLTIGKFTPLTLTTFLTVKESKIACNNLH